MARPIYPASSHLLLLGLALLLASATVVAQPDDQTGDRERYVVNAAGQILVVESPVNNEAQIVRRDGVNAQSDLIGFGDSAPGVSDDPGDPVHGPITGIGHPDMNGNGVMVSSVVLTSQNIAISASGSPPYNDSAIVTGTPGNLQTVARTLEEIDGFTVCAMEPLPQINASNQVFFGVTLEAQNVDPGGSGETRCFQDAGHIRTATDLEYPESKGIYRFTPGGSTDLLLYASMDQSLADEVTTSDPRWVESETTFDIIDAHLIAHSHGSVTDSGHALAFAWLTDDASVTNANCSSNDVNCTVRRGLLYLTGSSIELVALEQERVADPADNLDRYAFLDKGVGNSGGRVLFKAEDYGRWTSSFSFADDNGAASLNVWTSGGGLQSAALVMTGDAVPGAASGTEFNGFPPFQSLDDADNAAFTAGLEIPGICDDAASGDDFAQFCRGVYHANSSGTITEVARTTAAAQASGAGASSWTDGTDSFQFDSIGSVAVLGSSNAVYFVAFEALDPSGTGFDDPLELEPRGPERNDHNARTGVFRWQGGTIEKVVAEGDEIPLDRVWEEQVTDTGGFDSVIQGLAAAIGIESAHAQGPTATVIRLFTPMPQLRQHSGPGNFSIRAWLDTNGDGDADTDSMLGGGLPPAPVLPVPALSNWTFALLGMLLMLAGYLVIRGRPA